MTNHEPETPTPEEIADRYQVLQDRVASVGDLGEVSIVSVTKTHSAELVRSALAAGLRDFGENYAQELLAKATALGDLVGDAAALGDVTVESPRWHAIGPLQRNKVKKLAGVVHLWQTVDRRDLVLELAKRAPGAHVLLQVNTTDEPQKAGCEPNEVESLVEQARDAGLHVEGLMTLGPTDTSIDPGGAFRRCRTLCDTFDLGVCSMGMSGDFEQAITEGSTMIRVGSALFGARRGRI